MKLVFIDEDAKKATEGYDCIDTTQGAFKVYAFFYKSYVILATHFTGRFMI